jgi:hypothetical protein
MTAHVLVMKDPAMTPAAPARQMTTTAHARPAMIVVDAPAMAIGATVMAALTAAQITTKMTVLAMDAHRQEMMTMAVVAIGVPATEMTQICPVRNCNRYN